jgi:hypothetical protein
MVSLLVVIPHSVRCNGAVDASAMLTCQTPPLPGRPSYEGGRLRQNGGRLQIGMLDAIRSEWWAPSDQNAWTASLGIRKIYNHRRFAGVILQRMNKQIFCCVLNYLLGKRMIRMLAEGMTRRLG